MFLSLIPSKPWWFEDFTVSDSGLFSRRSCSSIWVLFFELNIFVCWHHTYARLFHCFFFANLASVILFVLFVCVWKVKVLNMIKRKKKARETKIKSNLEMRFVLLSGQIYCKWGEIKDKSQQMYHLKRKVLLNNTGVLLDTVCIVHTEIEN